MFPLPAPTLATSGRPNAGLDDWNVEVKLDGWRAIVGVSGEGYQVRTRRGRSIGERLPELRALTALGIEAVLDGELIAGAGRPAEFYELAGAMAGRRRDRPVCFVAFNVLRLNGTSDRQEGPGGRQSDTAPGANLHAFVSCRPRSR
jgi:bifunctional non-homologous end joining protein LigD